MVEKMEYRRIRKKQAVQSEGFLRLRVPKHGCFTKSPRFSRQITVPTPTIPANKLQTQHFLGCVPSRGHFVMAAVDLSFWARVLLQLRKKGENIHKSSCQLLSTFYNSHFNPSRTLESSPLSRQGNEA